jgi:hypothetical protein
MANFECKNRAMALTALDAIASSLQGAQQAAVLAVKVWVEANAPPEPDRETWERLKRIFEGNEWEQKGRAWLDQETSDPTYEGSTEGDLHHKHHEMIYEPEDGAELDCFWNAKYKAWEPIGYGWPGVLHKTDGASGEEE